MPDRDEFERRSESFDVNSATDQEMADKIREVCMDLYYLIESAKIKGLVITGCDVNGTSMNVMGSQFPVGVQVDISVVRPIIL